MPRADRDDGRQAMTLAPLVGLLLWLPAAVVQFAARSWLGFGNASLLPAALALASVAVLTRGLHLDGLADVGDALASYRDPARAREVMRQGDVGPLGVATLGFVVALQIIGLAAAIGQHHGTVSLLVAVLTGRLALTVGCLTGTPVAPGSTMGALVVGTVSRLRAALCTLAAVAVCGAAAQLDIDTADRGFETLQACAAPLVALLLLWPLRRHLIRRLGGVNGDVLGASCELAVMIALLVMAGVRPG